MMMESASSAGSPFVHEIQRGIYLHEIASR